MRSLLILFCCLFLFVNGRSVERTARGYHETVGIPKAWAMLRAENLRIVGGTPVQTLTAHPHQAGLVTLLTTGQTSICGGSVISNTRILTAAHCWWDGVNQARQFTVVLGSLTIFSGGTRIVSSDIVVHQSWNPNAVTNDIAIIKISRVNFNNNIQPIKLPTTADANKDFSGLQGTITGYGKTSDAQNSFPPSTSLHHTTVTIMTNRECQKSFEFTLHSSHLCTGGQGGVGTCDGDSGGPITVLQNNVRTQVGIVSFGPSDGCQRAIPSVYTRVTSFLSWINANL
uniref:Chymotrypsin-like serine protease n=1 Tax=Diatraea saccharalis TaxID=40085 RepID=A0A0M4M5D8_9NEOP|nr:chymotrypsin-like serine protease precursor [Diatraea saccharalis]